MIILYKTGIADWLSQDELFFYKLFSKFEHQLYLETINVTKLRITLSKLRLSSHRLEIEVGRWARPNRTPLDQRKCRVCDKVEDEFHFLLECGLYSQIRKKIRKLEKKLLRSIFGG